VCLITTKVCGILALSRALGDCELQACITWAPDINTVELTEEDTTLILACDGVWDVFSNEQAVAIAEAQPTAARAAIALRDAAYCMGSTDNISTIVMRFSQSE